MNFPGVHVAHFKETRCLGEFFVFDPEKTAGSKSLKECLGSGEMIPARASCSHVRESERQGLNYLGDLLTSSGRQLLLCAGAQMAASWVAVSAALRGSSVDIPVKSDLPRI